MMTDDSQERFNRELLSKEIDYRRELRWRIFAWAATLQTALIAGFFTLRVAHQISPTFECGCLLVASTMLLGSLAAIWLFLNLRREHELSLLWLELPGCKEASSPVRSCAISTPERRLGWASIIGLLMLTLAAIGSVLYDFPMQPN